MAVKIGDAQPYCESDHAGCKSLPAFYSIWYIEVMQSGDNG